LRQELAINPETVANWRKSQTYETIIVHLERRAVIDMLADRSVKNCAKWMRQHPEAVV